MKVIHIPGLPPMYTNTYMIFSQGGKAAVVDPAGGVQDYQKALEQEGATLAYIFLTHGHFDHVGSVVRLAQATGATVVMDTADAQGNQYYPLTPDVIQAGYKEGEPYRLDELEISCYQTPGHTPGSWCLYCQGYLFTGDTLFSGSIGRTDLPGGDMNQMDRSLEKLAALPLGEDTKVLPGHESFSTLGQEKKYNYYLRQFAR